MRWPRGVAHVGVKALGAAGLAARDATLRVGGDSVPADP